MKCEFCPPKCYPLFPANFRVMPGHKELPNPGNIENLHSLAHRTMPQYFDGIEVGYVHRFQANKMITTSWILSHTRPSGFIIGSQYTMRKYSNIMDTPTIHAHINPSTLSSNLGVVYYPLDCLRLEAAFQSSPKTAHPFNGVIELCRPSSTVTANFYNTSRESGRCTLSVLRSLTDNLALGAELRIEWNQPKFIMAETALAVRYWRYKYAMAATVSRQGFDASYWQRIHKSIQMATTLAYNKTTQQAIASLGYQWDFEDTTVKGKFDSELAVGFSYCRTLSHIPCVLGLSLLFSIPTNRFVFGLKMDLDPSGLRKDTP